MGNIFNLRVAKTNIPKRKGVILSIGLTPKAFYDNYLVWLFRRKNTDITESGEVLNYGTGEINGLIKNVTVATFADTTYFGNGEGYFYDETLTIVDYEGSSTVTYDNTTGLFTITAGWLSWIEVQLTVDGELVTDRIHFNAGDGGTVWSENGYFTPAYNFPNREFENNIMFNNNLVI